LGAVAVVGNRGQFGGGWSAIALALVWRLSPVGGSWQVSSLKINDVRLKINGAAKKG